MYRILNPYSADSTSKDMVISLKKEDKTLFFFSSLEGTCSGNRDANTEVEGGF